MPCLVISGQVKRADLKRDTRGPRMLGVQEVDIVSIVPSITKYAVTVEDPLDDPLPAGEGAVTWPGPAAAVPSGWTSPSTCRRRKLSQMPAGFELRPREPPPTTLPSAKSRRLLVALGRSERPVVVVGNGVRAAGAADDLQRGVARRLQAPVLTTWLGLDLIWR